MAVGLFSTAPGTLGEAVRSIADGVRHAGESETAARRRLLPGYAEGIEAIRARLPLDAEYLLVEEGRSPSFFWVQFDLAPRRWRSTGALYVEPQTLRKAGRPPDAPPWVVVARGLDRPPLLLTADQFFGEGPSR